MQLLGSCKLAPYPLAVSSGPIHGGEGREEGGKEVEVGTGPLIG